VAARALLNIWDAMELVDVPAIFLQFFMREN
jgi:hypothetical protein